jgi:succinoglycan biosynthesis protein ExoA
VPAKTPTVSVLLPVLDEVDAIDLCLESLAAQDYPPLEILVAEGGSTDGTHEQLIAWQERLPGLRVVPNPVRVQSHGLNLAANEAQGEVLVRADAHTTYAPDFIRRSVEGLLHTGATAVGGLQVPEGTGLFGKAVAAAMRSTLLIGGSGFRHATEPTLTDTVYLGAIRRLDFITNGGLRTLPSGVAEDADFYFRLRRAGGTVLVDPSIKSTYAPRENVRGLWRQFFRYGMGKVDMFYLNGRFPSWRPLGPLALIAAITGGMVAWLVVGLWWPLVFVLAAWLLVVTAAAKGRPLVAAAGAVMHLAYGLGLLRGFLRRPSTVRAAVR